MFGPWECIFEQFLLKKNGHNWVEKYHIGINFKPVLKNTCKKLFLKCQDNARFPSLCLASENVFLKFYSKNSHNSVENDHIRKKFKLILKTTYKKLFLKYLVNAKFPLLSLASENALLCYIFTPKKNGHNSVENDRTGKKITLVWRLPIRFS